MTIRESGLGLPDRDYYRLDEKGIVETREKYRTYIAQILRLGGVSDADATAKAEAIFKLETDIAEIHCRGRTARRRQDLQSHARSELVARRARFPLDGAPAGRRASRTRQRRAPGHTSRRNPTFPASPRSSKRTSVEVWRDYLMFHYLSGHAATSRALRTTPASSSTASDRRSARAARARQTRLCAPSSPDG